MNALQQAGISSDTVQELEGLIFRDTDQLDVVEFIEILLALRGRKLTSSTTVMDVMQTNDLMTKVSHWTSDGGGGGGLCMYLS